MQATIPDIFMSYSRDDEGRVEALVSALRTEGLIVWWDQDIEPNSIWAERIEESLKAARLAIVAWSPTSILSEQVKSEARLAHSLGKLLQVFVRRCRPPLFFGERQAINLTGWFEDGDATKLEALVQAITSMLEGQDIQAHSPQTRSIIRLLAQLRKYRGSVQRGDWFKVVPLTDQKGIAPSAHRTTDPTPILVGTQVKLVFDLEKSANVGVITIDKFGVSCLDDALSRERSLSLPSGKTEFFGPGDELLRVQPPFGDSATVALILDGPIGGKVSEVVKSPNIAADAVIELIQELQLSPEGRSHIAPYLYSVVD